MSGFKIEKQWITDSGLEAIVLAMDLGHRCGYVRIPENYPFYGKHHDRLYVEVHGGLTFSGHLKNQSGWWVGFDCAHDHDKKDFSIMGEQHKALYVDYLCSNDEFETVKTLEYCVRQCEFLAEQIDERSYERGASMKFRKKPVVIEAILFTYPPSQELLDWMGGACGGLVKARHPNANAELHIHTLEDGSTKKVKHVATEGDWIIKGVQGEFYPCKPDIFEMTYEAIAKVEGETE